MTEVIYLHLAS